jgi:hypothetical protein
MFSSRPLRILASLPVTVGCLLWLCVLVFCGTLYQAHAGLYAAQTRFFGAWFFLAFGFVPFPAVKTAVLVLSLHLVASMCTRLGSLGRRAGVWLIHIGIAVLVVGASLTHYLAQEAYVELVEGGQTDRAVVYPPGAEVGQALDGSRTGVLALPLTIGLLDFVKTDYRGTGMARDFESRLRVRGPGIDREVVVSMNRPFRYRDYTFYQFSYAAGDGPESSSLAVVKNPGRWLPYVASIVICMGLILHMAAGLSSAVGHRRAAT